MISNSSTGWLGVCWVDGEGKTMTRGDDGVDGGMGGQTIGIRTMIHSNNFVGRLGCF